MTDHTPGPSETDLLAALRQLVDGMTPGEWVEMRVGTRSGIDAQEGDREFSVIVFGDDCDDAGIHGRTDAEAGSNAAAIVAGSRALRLLADEATVEGLDTVIREALGESGPRDRAARAVIAHLAAQIVKEPQP